MVLTSLPLRPSPDRLLYPRPQRGSICRPSAILIFFARITSVTPPRRRSSPAAHNVVSKPTLPCWWYSDRTLCPGGSLLPQTPPWLTEWRGRRPKFGRVLGAWDIFPPPVRVEKNAPVIQKARLALKTVPFVVVIVTPLASIKVADDL